MKNVLALILAYLMFIGTAFAGGASQQQWRRDNMNRAGDGLEQLNELNSLINRGARTPSNPAQIYFPSSANVPFNPNPSYVPRERYRDGGQPVYQTGPLRNSGSTPMMIRPHNRCTDVYGRIINNC